MGTQEQTSNTSASDQGATICRARAVESLRYASAVCGSRERAIWLDVTRVWNAAELDPALRGRAARLFRTAQDWID